MGWAPVITSLSFFRPGFPRCVFQAAPCRPVRVSARFHPKRGSAPRLRR